MSWGVWCRDFMSWGDTLILVISRGVQLYYGIAHYKLVQVQFNRIYKHKHKSGLYSSEDGSGIFSY